jgi:hypothetical protein
MAELVGTSTSADPAVLGTNQQKGAGVSGHSVGGRGVEGICESFQGVFGHSDQNAGVVGECDAKGGFGVYGTSAEGVGVIGFSKTFQGVYGHSEQNAGVVGECNAKGGWGVYARSDDGCGVAGLSKSWQGVYGHSETQAGVVGVSEEMVGVWAENSRGDHPALFVRGAKLAGRFEGDVEVTGDIRLVDAGDCAELMAWRDSVEPTAGTVAVLGPEGSVNACRSPYDRAVAGVVSGAGRLRPGLVLGEQSADGRNVPLALMGRVYCQVDADWGEIAVGTLITSSPTVGHGMAASDPQRAFGAIIGKALGTLCSGRALLPILVALQ